MQKSKPKIPFSKELLMKSFYPSRGEVLDNKLSSFLMNGANKEENLAPDKSLPLLVYFGDLLINSGSRAPTTAGISHFQSLLFS